MKSEKGEIVYNEYYSLVQTLPAGQLVFSMTWHAKSSKCKEKRGKISLAMWNALSWFFVLGLWETPDQSLAGHVHY